MDEKNKNDANKYHAAVGRTFIILMCVVLAVFMLFVVSAIEEAYSRAEQLQERKKELHAQQSPVAVHFVTMDIHPHYLHLNRHQGQSSD